MHIYFTLSPCWLTLPEVTLKSRFWGEVFSGGGDCVFVFFLLCHHQFLCLPTSGICVAPRSFRLEQGQGKELAEKRRWFPSVCGRLPCTCLVLPLLPLEKEVESRRFTPFIRQDQKTAVDLQVTLQTTWRGLLMTGRW